MEVQYNQREEGEQVIGVNINISNSTSSDSSFTSDSSFQNSESMDTDNSGNNTTTVAFTNGEKPQIIEGTSVIEEALSQAQEDGANFEEPNKLESAINVTHNGESNGFTKKQNGDGVVEYPLPESNGGDGEAEIGATTSSFSKSPETDVGLKHVESWLGESSNGFNGTVPEKYNADNIVNKTLIVSGQSEIVEAGGSQEVELEPEEYEVEKVIHKQETHDLICPYCNHDITKRVILKRRKRKSEQISGGEEDKRIKPSPGVGTDVVERKPENESSEVKGDGSLDAISCFSCFSIFVPKGDGFLCWRFKPKPTATLQTDDPSAIISDQVEQGQEEKTGVNPFWILTCCQPYHAEKPDTPILSEPRAPITTETDPELPPSKNPVEEPLLRPAPELPVSVTPGEGGVFPTWMLSCCQPSEDRTKLEHAPKPGAKVPIHQEESHTKPSDGAQVDFTLQPIRDSDTPHPPKPVTLVEPVDEPMLPVDQQPLATPHEEKDTSIPSWFLTCCQPGSERKIQTHPETPDMSFPPTQASMAPDHDTAIPSKPLTSIEPDTETPVPHQTQPLTPVPHQTQPLTTAGGTVLWFVTCCQPSFDGKEPKPVTTQEEPVLSPDAKSQSTPEDDAGTGSLHRDRGSTSAQAGGTASQHQEKEPPSAVSAQPGDTQALEPIITPGPELTIPLKPSPLPKPDDDIPSPPEPEAPPTPPKKGEASVFFPEEQTIPPSSVTPTDTPETHLSHDIEAALLPREPTRAGVSGMDIIKAIVYGGLLECITSLSVITSAAGGDATTLNIVALGLANVCGGFVLLLHNLRVLKHEQTTERYEDQLGRPGHFLLHAIVAVLSYLTFGLMSPIIYGFTFRKSDNKDYKLATLAGASLLCITIISTAKAYVRRPPKAYFQTVFYYISVGFMVSGVGYVAGDLINMLLKKLGVFNSREAPAAMNGAWSTY